MDKYIYQTAVPGRTYEALAQQFVLGEEHPHVKKNLDGWVLDHPEAKSQWIQSGDWVVHIKFLTSWWGVCKDKDFRKDFTKIEVTGPE